MIEILNEVFLARGRDALNGQPDKSESIVRVLAPAVFRFGVSTHG